MKHSVEDQIYLGIDVHQRTYSVTAVANRAIVKTASMPADPEVLLKFLRNQFPNKQINSVYEAGFSGLGLHRFLKKNKINNTVVHPASIEVAVSERAKTDKRDSRKMAFQLSEGRLKCIHIPSEKREQWRAVSRLRSSLVKERSRIGNKLKGLMFYFGLIPYNIKKRTTRKYIKSFLSNPVKGDIEFCVQEYCYCWIFLDDKIKDVEKRLKIQAKQDRLIDEPYQNNHGVGTTSARILANELGDMKHFSSEKGLYSFIGLTPQEYSSGEHIRLGSISRKGNPEIRQILVEAAWRAIRKDENLKEVFERIAVKAGRKKAILGIARRMIGHTRAEFKGKEQSML